MASRQDKDVVVLSIVSNELVRRGAVDRLPDDLQGDAIPRQVREHERSLETREAASGAEDGEQEAASAVFDDTAAALSRVRHAVLAAYPLADDPQRAAFGPLGATRKPHDNQVRLAAIATAAAAAVAAGELVLPPDLAPEALAAQAERHASVAKTKAGRIAARQVEGQTVRDERRETKAMLARLKAFVTAFYGPEALASFGFTLPVPAARPRLAADPTDPRPAEPVTPPTA
jgi:hypothetical protein